MQAKPPTTSRPYPRRGGLTLIEVIAAITILGTVLVGVVLSKSRHTRQNAAAASQLRVTEAADRLITGWWTSAQGVPLEGRGRIEDPRGGLSWATRVVDHPTLEALGTRVVRVEVWPDAATPSATARTLQAPEATNDEALPTVIVELVVPAPGNSPETFRSNTPVLEVTSSSETLVDLPEGPQ